MQRLNKNCSLSYKHQGASIRKMTKINNESEACVDPNTCSKTDVSVTLQKKMRLTSLCPFLLMSYKTK